MFNYSCLLNNTNIYVFKEFNTLANKLALTLFLYFAKEPKTLANKLVFTLFLYLVKDNILANKLNYTIYAKLITFEKRLGIRLKTVSKDLCYSISIFNQRR